MATTFSATKTGGAQTASAGIGDGGTAKTMVCSYTWSAALVINDLIESPPIQAGSTILDAMIYTDSMGAAAVTLDLGYGTDPDYFLAASTIGVAGGPARASAAAARPLLLTATDTIDLLVKVAPTTPTTSGTVTLIVTYLPPNA